MIRKHDEWSKLGEENLGLHNIQWAEMRAHGGEGHAMGFFTLMKCILNDHWADQPKGRNDWDSEHIDYVMSKLYYCWVRMLWDFYPEEEE